MLGFNDIDKTLAKSDVFDKRSEIEYQAARSGLRFVANRIRDGVATFMESTAEVLATTLSSTVGNTLQFVLGAELARDVAALAGAFGSRMAGMVGMGLAAGVSAAFTQMDYVHQKRNIRSFYLGEVASRVHKQPCDVTMADVESVAKQVPVIDEELSRARRQRNFGVPLAVVCTLLSFAAVTVALPAVAGALSIALPTSMVGSFLLNAAVSMGTYFATKMPLQSIGNKLFDLNVDTTNDRIFHIKNAKDRGQTISQAQVLGVFVKADAKLAGQIEKEQGLAFDAMDAQAQARVANVLDGRLKLSQLAADINNGAIHPTELAFLAAGTTSGIPPQRAPEPKQEAVPEKSATKHRDRLGEKALATKHTERISLEAEASSEKFI